MKRKDIIVRRFYIATLMPVISLIVNELGKSNARNKINSEKENCEDSTWKWIASEA